MGAQRAALRLGDRSTPPARAWPRAGRSAWPGSQDNAAPSPQPREAALGAGRWGEFQLLVVGGDGKEQNEGLWFCWPWVFVGRSRLCPPVTAALLSSLAL